MSWSGLRSQVSGLAATTLSPLLILYPLLLLLDDLEPGFVRSVVNPHWFLLTLIVVGMLASSPGREQYVEHVGSPQGGAVVYETAAGYTTTHRAGTVLAVVVAAIICGVWAWWRVHAGAIGVVVGVLAAGAIGAVVWTLGNGSDDAREVEPE